VLRPIRGIRGDWESGWIKFFKDLLIFFIFRRYLLGLAASAAKAAVFKDR